MRFDEYRVNVPVGERDGWAVSRFEVPELCLENLRNAREGRHTQPGEYTRLMGPTSPGSGTLDLWMSDTDAEVMDHWKAMMTVKRSDTKAVLIHGLGLGLVLQQAILSPATTTIDVVERSPEVIALVGPHYQEMAERAHTRLVIHNDDALTRKWPAGMRWDMVWHDIWLTIDDEARVQMERLTRSFGSRTKWQGAWGKAETARLARSR